MLITKASDIRKVINAASDTSQFTIIDTETDGTEPFKGTKMCGVSIKIPSHDQSYYIPFRHRSGKNADTCYIKELSRIVSNPKKSVIMWNAPFDVHVLSADELDVKCRIVDAQLGSHLLYENETGATHGFPLKPMGAKYIDPGAADAEAQMIDIIGGKDKIHLADPAVIDEYACQDVELTWGLFLRAYTGLKSQGLIGIFDELSDYIAATIDMERTGVLVDVEKVTAALGTIDRDVQAYLGEIRSHLNDPKFNPGPNSLSVRNLFNRKKGESCDKDFLESEGSPEAKMILNYRALAKMRSSFLEPMLRLKDEHDRCHPSIKLHGTVSGRPSCSGGLNWQALPRAGGNGPMDAVRGMVVAPEGWVILSFDWSQIELRLLAHYTNDPNLVKAYTENLDLHTMTGEFLGIDRDWAKRMNFGSVYGLGADGFARNAKISKVKAARALNAWHDQYPTVKRLYKACENKAKKDGYIRMWTGRRKRYTEHWECRKAMSGLIQGGVAEIMRVALTKLHLTFKDNPDVKLFLQVHDDVLAYVRADVLQDVIPVFRDVLQDFDFRVPIITETKYGNTWGSLVKVK